MLEDLGRREVPVLLAAALHLLILLDPVEDLPQVAWVVGARNGTFRTRPHPGSRHYFIFTYRDYCPPEVLGSTRAKVPLREFLEPGVPEPDLTWPIPE